MNQPLTPSVSNSEQISLREDEIDLKALFSKLRGRKFLILAIALLLSVLVAAFHLFKKSVYIPSGYELPIMFTFAGAERGEYPNGERFTIDDLISSQVLLSAMQEAGAPDDIIGATDVRPGNGLTTKVEQLIVEQLQQKKLTETQLEALREGLSRAQSQARQYAELYVDSSRTSANLGQIQSYLSAVPRIWSAKAVSERGVLEVRYQATNNPFVLDTGASLIKEFFRFEGYLDLLKDSIDELSTYGVANLSALSGPSGQRLSEVRLSLDSVRIEFNDLISMIPTIVSGNSDASDRTSLSLLAAKRRNLQLEHDRLLGMVKVYDDSLSLLGNRLEGGVERERFGSEGDRNLAGGVYSPQFSDQMFESLLQLGKTVSDAEQRAMIIEKRIATSEKIQDVNLRLARLSSARGEADQLLDKESVLQLVGQQIDSANGIQANIKAISEQVSQQLLGSSRVLWEVLGPVRDAEGGQATVKRFVMQVAIAFVLGLMLALLLALVLPGRERVVAE